MRVSVSIVDEVRIHFDEFCPGENQLHTLDCVIDELKPIKIRSGFRPIELANIGDTIIVTKTIMPNSLVVGVTANVIQIQ